MNLQIRRTKLQDIPLILELMREFAEFEYLLEFLEVTEENLHEVLFSENAFVHSLVAFDVEKAVAYTIFYPHFSSFSGQKSVYLEDIYISENYRKYGLGEKMLKEIAKLGREFGAVRMDFQVLKWNTPAVRFYEKHGAEIDEEERHCRISDEAFLKLAGE